jgi:hypothetical protein
MVKLKIVITGVPFDCSLSLWMLVNLYHYCCLQKLLDKVIEDCSKALEYNNKYAKALFRRAKAYETTNNLMACLEGTSHL